MGDNRATDILVTKEGATSRSRHFELATIFVKYMVMRLVVVCKLVATQFMIADIFTKATDEDTFLRMRHELRNEPIEEYAARTKSLLTRILQRIGIM